MPPEMKSVFSTMVSEIGYDEDTAELYVTWPKGKTSVYSGVPADVAHTVMNSWSVGQAINSEIKAAGYSHRYA